MKKIKVLHIIHALQGGGAERFAVDLAKFLDKDKFEVEFVCLRGQGEWREELTALGIKIKVLGGIKGLSFLSFGKLLAAIKASRADIVHTHLFWADFFGRIAAKMAGVKAIISTEQNLNYSEGFLRRLGKIATARLAAVIVAISQAVKDYAISFEGAKEGQIRIIPNGLEIEKFLDTARNYEFGSRPPVIGSIGRLAEQKGFATLIAALREVSGVRCLIAGEGEKRKELQEMIAGSGQSEKIKLVGWQSDTKSFLSSLDIFVLPSRWEGLGIVILEAGLSGLPVIGSEVGGIAEIISDSEDGLLFAKDDYQELAAKLKLLIADRELRARLGQGLQKKIRENYDIRKIAGKYSEIYAELINK